MQQRSACLAVTVDVTELLPTDEDHQDSFKDSADPRNLVRIHGPDGALLASNRLATFVFCAFHSLPSRPFLPLHACLCRPDEPGRRRDEFPARWRADAAGRAGLPPNTDP